VEMFQWREDSETDDTEDKVGGSQTVQRTYTYSLQWVDHPIDSSRFRQGGHNNPHFPDYSTYTFVVPRANFGNYILGPPLIDQANWYEAIPLNDTDLENISEPLKKQFKIVNGQFYSGGSNINPQAGDIRISFSMVPVREATVMGRQVGDSFEGWEPVCPCFEHNYGDESKYDEEKQSLLVQERKLTVRHDQLLYLTYGIVSAQHIIEEKRRENAFMTWIWRLIGFIMMCGGLYALFAPIIVFLKVIPFIANVVGAGLFFASFLTTLVLTFVIVSFAWVIARPFLVTFLVAAGVGLFVLFSKVRA